VSDGLVASLDGTRIVSNLATEWDITPRSATFHDPRRGRFVVAAAIDVRLGDVDDLHLQR
jgi:hypothetical protein